MLIGGQEFPTECPENCPGKRDSNLCRYCPIFNCVGENALLKPGDYRKDWALAWKRWFDSGMVGLPDLRL